jgi:hypothetical protein
MAKTEGCRAIVVRFVDAIGDGRLDDARSLLHDDFVIHAAGASRTAAITMAPQNFSSFS